MAIITSALLTALHTGYRRDFERGKAKAAPMWDRIATEIRSSSSKNTYGWLGQFPKMREWVGERVVKDMKAHAYEIDNKTYEATVGVGRDDIEDDNLGTYSAMMEEMGYGARTEVDNELWPLLQAGEATPCYDGQNFFDADHPVYANHDGTGAATSVSNITDDASGSVPWYVMCTKRPLKPMIYQNRREAEFVTKFDPRTSDHVFMANEFLWGVDMRFNVGFGLWQFAHLAKVPLNSDNLFAVIEAMMAIRADGGRPLGVMPDLLVVPPALEGAATKTVKVMQTDGGASNPTYQRLDVAVSPWLI